MGIMVLLGRLSKGGTTYVLCILLPWCYLMLVVSTTGNSYMLSSKVGKSIYMGLNVSWLFVLAAVHLSSLNIVGVGVYMMGRISGFTSDMMIRSVGLSNGLCVSLCGNRILDLGYISLCCDIGVVGVKVGTIL